MKFKYARSHLSVEVLDDTKLRTWTQKKREGLLQYYTYIPQKT